MKQHKVKQFPTNQKGFTIVELLIVIVVIGILAAIVIVAYNGVQARAQASKYKTDTQQILKKAELYRTIYSAYPGYPSTASYSWLDFYNGDNTPKLNGIKVVYWNEANDGVVTTTSPFPYSTLKDLADGKNGSYPVTSYLVATCTGGNGYKVVYPDPSLNGGTNVIVTTGTGC